MSDDDYFKAFPQSKLDASVWDQQNINKLFTFDFVPAVARTLFHHPYAEEGKDKNKRARDYAAVSNAAAIFNFMLIFLITVMTVAMFLYKCALRQFSTAFAILFGGLLVLVQNCLMFVYTRVMDAEVYQDART